ncbi:cbb3-type cytochrome c oxidase subunit I [Brevibacterium jeotgali]|uniref:cbb3-type cytochrome c oxidase subunit I n=1 Tax=Brevibacterium jeotgali TaxID=1262550 RepID=UPI0011A6141C|nr:cbb3-type cytochrome c oxidase subunit I [Brevibacterium jeotgali]
MGLSPGPASRPRAGSPRRRGVSPLRDLPVVLWLLLAAVAAVFQPYLREAVWVMVHLALLGAMTHAVLVWSTFFAQALLKTPESVDPAAHQSIRQAGMVVGVCCVITGVPTSLWPLVLVGATVVAAAVVWHGIAMGRRLRAALPSRFAVTVRYYLAASVCLPVGAVLGVLLARWPASELFGRLLVAHTLTMLLGWLGLTIMGTLVTFWPTMLRTRVDPRASVLAQQALPIVLAGLTLIDIGALAAVRWLVVAGLIVHLVGVIWWGRALAGPFRTAPPRRAPGVFAAAALVWGLVLLVSLVVHVATSGSWGTIAGGYQPITLIAVLGFTLQLLTGALSQLIPTVLGGGPRVRAAVDAEFGRLLWARFAVLNTGLVVALSPVPGEVQRVALAGVMVAVALLVPLLLRGIVVGVRARRTDRTTLSQKRDEGRFVD